MGCWISAQSGIRPRSTRRIRPPARMHRAVALGGGTLAAGGCLQLPFGAALHHPRPRHHPGAAGSGPAPPGKAPSADLLADAGLGRPPAGHPRADLVGDVRPAQPRELELRRIRGRDPARDAPLSPRRAGLSRLRPAGRDRSARKLLQSLALVLFARRGHHAGQPRQGPRAERRAAVAGQHRLPRLLHCGGDLRGRHPARVVPQGAGGGDDRRFLALHRAALHPPAVNPVDRPPPATVQHRTMDVVLIDVANDPITKLYGAYRTCYTPKTPREVWDDIAAGTVPREKIAQFVEERLKTGHVSPLEQVVFWFGISGVSRSLSHQFVRHRIGISFEQQSQRYVRFTGKNEERLEYVMPESWREAGRAKEFEKLMEEITRVYREAVAAGIPAEDARFVLPNAAPTNFQIMVNFAELLHIADLRLCTRAQWEIR